MDIALQKLASEMYLCPSGYELVLNCTTERTQEDAENLCRDIWGDAVKQFRFVNGSYLGSGRRGPWKYQMKGYLAFRPIGMNMLKHRGIRDKRLFRESGRS